MNGPAPASRAVERPAATAHSRTVARHAEWLASRLPSGPNSRAVTGPSPRPLARSQCDSVLQVVTPAGYEAPPTARCLKSGLKTIAVAALVGDVRVRSALPVSASHSV